jgi:hypothetical protein
MPFIVNRLRKLKYIISPIIYAGVFIGIAVVLWLGPVEKHCLPYLT